MAFKAKPANTEVSNLRAIFRYSRGAILILCVAALIGGVDAEVKQQKQDISKDLIGVWELTFFDGEPAPKGPMFLELAKDGKLRSVVIAADAIVTGEGTYEIKGRTLKTKTKCRGKEAEDTSEIKKLTDTELWLMDQDGKEEKYKRHE